LPLRRDLAAEVTVETGRRDGGPAYVRVASSGHVLVPVGGSRVLVRVQGASRGRLPPHRAFVLGGRATLQGDDFREWAGAARPSCMSSGATAVPFLRMAAGPARTPGTITLAPFVARVERSTDRGTPWSGTPGHASRWRRAEWLGRVPPRRGYGLESRRLRAAFDVNARFLGHPLKN